MKLEKLLKNIQNFKIVGSTEIEISKIVYDSREVKQNDIFIAIKGLNTDGHLFISKAIESGAKCIVLEDEIFLDDKTCNKKGITKIKVENTSKTMSLMANAYFDFPAHNMKVIGITGTNGKTTTGYLVKSLMETSGEKVGLIGTINYSIDDVTIPANKTTPESIKIFEVLNEMRKCSITTVVMEVSSHSLALNRVFGLDFDIAVFTNLTQDHLDFHQNMTDYFKAKKILFDNNLKYNGVAIYNKDDVYGSTIASDFIGRQISYGLKDADATGTIIDLNFNGLKLIVNYQSESFELNSSLTGKFNAYNLLSATSVGLSFNIDSRIIKTGLEKITAIPGRFQKFNSKKGFWIIVDYSHTPDSLYNALLTVKQVMDFSGKGRVITIFGCGGNRDKTKRPQMGKIASELSNKVIITSDNPRDENPEEIIEDIFVGIRDKQNITRDPDRYRAIISALSQAEKGDIVLVAGKGHENYQEIKGIKYHFDDSEIIQNYLLHEE